MDSKIIEGMCIDCNVIYVCLCIHVGSRDKNVKNIICIHIDLHVFL